MKKFLCLFLSILTIFCCSSCGFKESRLVKKVEFFSVTENVYTFDLYIFLIKDDVVLPYDKVFILTPSSSFKKYSVLDFKKLIKDKEFFTSKCYQRYTKVENRQFSLDASIDLAFIYLEPITFENVNDYVFIWERKG